MQSNVFDIINQVTTNYEPNNITKSLFLELDSNIIENINFFISLHYNDTIFNLFQKLSENDKKTLFNLKVTTCFKIKTINCLINETVEDEEKYEKDILNYLTRCGLGEFGKGVPTKDILANIGGNATYLRNRLSILEDRKLVVGIGKTISKTWVIASLEKEAKKKAKLEMGIR